MLKRIISLLIFFTLAAPLWAQKDSVMQINQAQWHEISDGVDYTETFKKETDDKPKNKKNNFNTSLPSSDLSGFKYLFYFLVVALVIFLIIRIFGNFKSNTAIKEKVISIDSITEIEENMHEINLENLLNEALLVKNYKIALRLNFLIVIKLLSQKGKITWAKEKTNWEYYNELKEVLLADQFKEIILSFETFWYGDHPLTENQYLNTEPYYKAIQKRLNPHE